MVSIVGAVTNGIMISFLPALLRDLGFQNTTFGDADFGIIGLALGNLITLVQPQWLFSLIILAVLAGIFLLSWNRNKGKKNEEEKTA